MQRRPDEGNMRWRPRPVLQQEKVRGTQALPMKAATTSLVGEKGLGVMMITLMFSKKKKLVQTTLVLSKAPLPTLATPQGPSRVTSYVQGFVKFDSYLSNFNLPQLF